MRSRLLLSGAVAATLALGLLAAGCGGSDDTGDAATTTSAASTAATAAATPADLVPALDGLVTTSLTPAEHAAQVVGGDDLTPTFVKLKAYLAQGPPVTFRVENVTTDGDTARADVQILNGGTPLEELYPSFWQQVDGEWKVTRTGACSLIAVSGITCPDAPVG